MNRLCVCVLGLAMAVGGGCGGDDDGGKDPVPSSGRVLFRNRQPAKTATVRVTGCADQYTSVDGSFDTSCAASTYDVAVKYGNVGLVFQGLTRRDPVVTLPFALGSAQASTVSGTATGYTSGRAAGVTVSSSEYSSSLRRTTDGSYTAGMQWFGVTPPAATARALEWTPASGLPTAFTGYGTAAVTLAAGVNPTVSPALSAVANGAIDVAIADFDLAGLWFDLWVTWPDGGVAEIVSAAPGATSATVATPDVAGATFAVVAERGVDSTSWGWRRGLASTSSPAAIALPTAPTFSAPSAGATVDLTTDFTFGALAEAVYLVGFESTTITPLLYVVTRSTSVRIPDFSWAGLSLPAATSLNVSIRATGPCTSMDAVAASTELLSFQPSAWGSGSANRVPAVDGFATRYVMSATTP